MSEPLKFCYQDKTHVPTGGWYVKCPVTGKIVEGGNFNELVKGCESQIVATGQMPPTDLSLQVENSLCERLGAHPLCGPCSKSPQTLGFTEIVRWVRAMYNFATKGNFELVSQEEAERRATICAACPYQVSTSGCWGCRGIAGMLPAIAGARKTSRDQQLKACGVCGCYNAVSVHLPLNVQQDGHLQFPDFCWKKPNNSQSE